MFAKTEHNVRCYATEKRWKALLLLMTALLILPVLVILTLLIVRGGPAISLEFLTAFPIKGMTEG